MAFLFFSLISGLIGLSYEVIYQRAFSLINGDLQTTYAIITLTFMLGMALGNLSGFKFRRLLPVFEIAGGLFSIAFCMYLRLGGYMASIPNLVMVAILLVPSFIVGIHIPLYAYYFKKYAFDSLYFLYHIGAAAGIIALEFFVFSSVPLSVIFFALGVLHISIGLLILHFFRTGRFVIEEAALSLSEVASIINRSKKWLGGVFLCSAGSFYLHMFIIKFALQYGYIVRAMFSFFIAFSVLYVGVGAFIARRIRLSLEWILTIFAAHALVVILLSVPLANELHYQDWSNLSYYLLLMNAFLFSPLMWATVFFCKSLAKACDNVHKTDVFSGTFLFFSAIGNIAGFVLAIVSASWIIDGYFALSFVLLLISGAALVNFRRLLAPVVISTLCVLVFLFVYDINAVANSAFHKLPYIKGLNIPRVEKISAGGGTIIKIMSRENTLFSPDFELPPDFYIPPSLFYFINGYRSHNILRWMEVIVGILPRRYFDEPLDKSLIIGVGSGQTVAGVSAISRQSIAVDIDPFVFEFLPELSEYNNNLWNNPAVKLVNKDAFTYLKENDENFSLIFNTATNQYTYGAAKLHTEEFLELAKSRLSPDGVYFSWVDSHGVKTSDDLFQVVGMHKKYFRYVDIHFAGPDYLLLFSYDKNRPDLPLIGPQSAISDADMDWLIDTVTLDSDNQLPVYRDVKYSPPNQPLASTLDYPALEIMALDNFFKRYKERVDFMEIFNIPE